MSGRQAHAPCRSGTRGAAGQAGPGSDRHAAYARRRRRQIAYGQWRPWADAGPVREHVTALRRHGVTYRAIAEAGGVSPSMVYRLVHGCVSQAGQLACRVGSAPAGRLLAVTVPAAAGGGVRDACGARRRLRALVALGHSQAALAREAGITKARMQRLVTGQARRISPALHAVIEELYDQMWNHLPAERTRREQAVAEAARRRAEAAGWPPPMALDDDRIDDPAYRPRTAWRRAAGLPPAAQPPEPRLCTTSSAGPGYPQEQAAGVTAAPDRCQARSRTGERKGA